MRGESDGRLVRRVLDGDRQAYASLVERYRDRLGRYAVRMLGNVADAEDAVQDTFIRGYRSLGRCDPDRFGSWMFGILVNRCRTYGAERARRQAVLVSDDGAVQSAAVQPDDPNTWQATIEWALCQLPAEQREAFLLKHVEDLSYEEMQQLTGTRISALKMRVFRAREALRALLEETVRG